VTATHEPRLLVIGGLSSDTITTQDGEVHLNVLGGNAVYAAIGACCWGVKPSVVGLIGADYPSAWLADLDAAGIDVTHVQRVSGPHQNYFATRYRSDGDREPYVPVEAFAAAGMPLPEPLRRMTALLAEADGNRWRATHETRTIGWRADPRLVPASGWDVDACLLVPAALARHREWLTVARSAIGPAVTVFLDPEEEQGHVLTATDLVSILGDVDVVMPSLRQLDGLIRGGSLSRTARLLASMGPAVVAIKLGADGCLVYEAGRDRESRIPAYPTGVVDATGAGDAFCGGFVAGYLRTGDAVEAGLHGAVSASFAIEGFGALDALRYGPGEAERRLRALREAITTMHA
jgi:sugar/nucleoside kinase (ribokinase family)